MKIIPSRNRGRRTGDHLSTEENLIEFAEWTNKTSGQFLLGPSEWARRIPVSGTDSINAVEQISTKRFSGQAAAGRFS